ncbi:MAG: 4Fe-4S dicluster domain-containing protein [Elusimicrobiota bacterium]
MTPENIIEKVRNAGVVGAGGAGFPTHIKLQAKVNTVIANGAECEPLLKIDQQVMALKCEKVVRGLDLVMESTGAGKGIIAIKKKYHKACEVMLDVVRNTKKDISVFHLDNYYPAGDEFTLVYDVTGRIIPEGGLPLNVGCVVNNVITLINIADAVDGGMPVTDRPVTICGAVKKPISIILPVGTPVETAIQLAGGATISDYVILDGGPMMGVVIPEGHVITKKTSGVIILPPDITASTMKTSSVSHTVKQVKSACEQCRDCTEICPRFLLGHKFECHKIQRSVGAGKFENLTTAFLCSECGLCDWVCPMRLLPRRVNQEVKKQLISHGIKNPHKGVPVAVHSMRQYRKVPPERVMGRLDVLKYDNPAPLTELAEEIRQVRIPLLQNVGVPSEPMVKIGDRVKKGDLIAKIPEGKLSANLHASIDGRITGINGYIKIER